jgi:hypothetical protein
VAALLGDQAIAMFGFAIGVPLPTRVSISFSACFIAFLPLSNFSTHGSFHGRSAKIDMPYEFRSYNFCRDCLERV